MQGEIIATTLGLGFTFFIFAAFIIVFVVLAKKTRQKKAQEESAARYKQNNASVSPKQVEITAQQRAKLESYDRHQKDAHEHGHSGEEEHYEEIVGSLGVVNDEGCADLSGVRFIAHDFAYEIGDGDNRDYTKLAQAMVLGDIFNNPRFKKPYSRK